MSSEPSTAASPISLSLVSHTNSGKTTLARTLLRRDVGEVLDQAHVTETSEPYTLLEPGGDAGVLLWDTPGFGDSVRLQKRLEGRDNPLGWILSQTWDRLADRPLWCGQQAVLNMRERSDAILYLVNASEDPEMAGYLEAELLILEWVQKPVIAVLNYTGAPQDTSGTQIEEARWRTFFASHSIVRDVLSLDAFSRCWVQEGVLLERIQEILPETRRKPMARLIDDWRENNLAVFHGSMKRLSELIATTASDHEASEPTRFSPLDVKRASKRLAARYTRDLRAATTDLIRLNGLDGEDTRSFEASLEDVTAPNEKPPPWRAGLLGSAAGGAAGGVVADFAVGGLSFGSGAVIGAALGAMGLGGLAWGYRRIGDRTNPRIVWSEEFLDRTLRDAALRYLAIAHFGRGSGEYEDRAVPKFWHDRVNDAFEARRNEYRDVWAIAQAGRMQEVRQASVGRLVPILKSVTCQVLIDLYPGTQKFLAETAPRPNQEP
ncbi:DUF3482 domain-containing protein [Myxococcota bacterium]|nr:DUF3482 domain-containing protein [Myxococcota bacterium]